MADASAPTRSKEKTGYGGLRGWIDQVEKMGELVRVNGAEIGDPEKYRVGLRVGRQAINYNNTIFANSEWRNQGRSYDAVVTNLHYDEKLSELGIINSYKIVSWFEDNR